jgi:hypothetical protein
MALEWIRPMFAKPFRVKAWHPETSEELVNYEGALGATNPMFVVGWEPFVCLDIRLLISAI